MSIVMSTVFAKILGIYFFAIGIAFFINTERFKNIYKQVSKDENFLFLGSVLAMLIGAVVISLHNIWVWDWPVIITILGWWSLIKGFALFVHPGFINAFSFIENRSTMFYKTASLVYAIVGLFLLYKGFEG
jgi:hypothetical protein